MTASTRRAALGAILAAPLAAAPVFAAPPSDLARACDAAVARLNYVNSVAATDIAWTDDMISAENQAFDAVLHRITNEPAQSFGDTSAKARLLLCELRENVGIDDHLDAGQRALIAFLREVGSAAEVAPCA